MNRTADRFVTLHRDHKDYISYLNGTFSRLEIAVPVRGFDVDVHRDKITFLVRPRKPLALGDFLIAALRLMRLELFPLTGFPMVAVAIYLHSSQWSISLWLAFFSLMFLHGGVFAFNDYVDHVKGRDQLGGRGTSPRILQTGVWPAQWALRWSGLQFVIASALAAPFLILQPILIGVGIAALALGVFGYTLAQRGWLRIFVGGTSAFVAFGPLLILGSILLLSPGSLVLSPLFLGLSIWYGWVASFFLRLRQFATMMVDAQAGIKTFATWLGFDRAKVLLLADLLTLVLFGSFCAVGASKAFDYRTLVGLVGLVAGTGVLAWKVIRISSPAGSSMERLSNLALWWLFSMNVLTLLLIWARA
jgi:1,4-dihydroxy-2-naphthoate octaprenyltransferase